MANINKLNALAATFGAAVAATTLSAPVLAADNPFATKQLSSGYMQLAEGGEHGAEKGAEGSCGEGKCGGEAGAAKGGEGKCGEGKCGGEGGAAKGGEGKCGEGKCGGEGGAAKGGEGKCGEGKCGGEGGAAKGDESHGA